VDFPRAAPQHPDLCAGNIVRRGAVRTRVLLDGIGVDLNLVAISLANELGRWHFHKILKGGSGTRGVSGTSSSGPAAAASADGSPPHNNAANTGSQKKQNLCNRWSVAIGGLLVSLPGATLAPIAGFRGTLGNVNFAEIGLMIL
jgi:hypothetical protein